MGEQVLILSNTGKCMDDHIDIGVGIWDCIGSSPQTWIWTPLGSIKRADGGMCVALEPSGKLTMKKCNSKSAVQMWDFEPAQYRRGWGSICSRSDKSRCISHKTEPLMAPQRTRVSLCESLWIVIPPPKTLNGPLNLVVSFIHMYIG